MPAFRYVAIDPAGKYASGVMEALDEAEVINRLQRDGCTPMRAEPVAAGRSFSGLVNLQLTRRGLSSRELAAVTRELSVMLGAGQDLDRSLRFMAEIAPGARVRRVLEQLRAAVRDGTSLAASMAQHPASFSRLYVGMVRAGEAGGSLAATLERLALLLERERSLVSSIQSAMIYPALLLLASIGSVVLLLTQVLPQFVPLFAENNAALPASTQFMLDAGGFLSAYGLYGLLALAAFGLAAVQMLRQPGPRLLADRLLLRLPIIGSLTREVQAARFSRTLGTLLINGVPLVGALTIVRDALGNRAAIAAVERTTVSVRGGAGLATPLAETNIFPVQLIYLLRLGEETAQLGPLAVRAAEIHEESTRLSIQRLVALLVPVITITLGALVAGIVSSLILAMLSLNNLAT